MREFNDYSFDEKLSVVLMAVLTSIIVYSIYLVIHGLFFRKMWKGKFIKYIVSIFPAFVFGLTVLYQNGIFIFYDDE
jgi:hypothetical protein